MRQGDEEGEESKRRSDTHIHDVEVQERGDIFFFYRPKVDNEDPHGPQHVQRLYVILHPRSGENRLEQKQESTSGKEGSQTQGGGGGAVGGGHGTQQVDIEQQELLRFIIMGRKSLPDPSRKSAPYWGFVEMVTTDVQQIKDALKGEDYETATRGKRHQPSARAVGEGVYAILRHNPAGRRSSSSSKMHTHLVYKLEYPQEGEDEEPQRAMNIAREASFLLQIKNPEQPQSGREFRGLGNKRKAAFPAWLQGAMGHGRYHPADPPDFLNYEGCEFLLIAASDDIEQELGVGLKTDDECSDLLNTFGESSSVSTRPLLKGTWV